MLTTLSRRAMASRGLLGAASRHVRPSVAPAAAFHSGALCVMVDDVGVGAACRGGFGFGVGERRVGGQAGGGMSYPVPFVDDGGGRIPLNKN